MKKAIHAFAAAALLAAPLHANAAPDHIALLKQRNSLTESAAKFAEKGNYPQACDAYIKQADFSEKHGLQLFRPLAGSAKRRDLISRGNLVTAKSNGYINSNGEFLCGKANKTWKTRNWPTVVPAAYRVDVQISQEDPIKLACMKEWGTNYRMVKYCYDKQTEAKRALGL